ncbi:MAG: PQQ-binding-like beta-propeller repeat protein [Planctomycetaceae bacterium]
MPAIRLLLLTPVVLLNLCLTVHADNWGSWRGPTQNGVCSETSVPREWSKDVNVAWRTALPGPAGATPVVWGERIFLTSVDGEKLLLMCFDTSGKQLWQHQVGTGNRDVRGDEGNSASPSPITDGQHVWVLMGTGDLACLTVEGQPVWQFNVQDRYGKLDIAFGLSSTPVLHDGRLLLQLIHGDGKAATQEALVAAVDAKTGDALWKTDRITGAENENEHSYSSPILYDFGGLTLLITHGADYTIAYDTADGHEVWRLGGLNPHDDPARAYHPTLRFVASPSAAEGIVVIPTAKGGPVFAVRPDRTGDITGTDAVLWTRDKHTPDVPSPVIFEDLVYLCRENGMLLVLDRATGEEVYMERTHNDRHRASPLLADGHLYLTARDGKVTVVRLGRKFEIVSQNEVGEACSASPVIANGTLYLRTFDALWAIREARQ